MLYSKFGYFSDKDLDPFSFKSKKIVLYLVN